MICDLGTLSAGAFVASLSPNSWMPLLKRAGLILLLTLPAFARAQFEYTLGNDGITITGYSGAGGEVAIPESIDGAPVTGIGPWAFRTFFLEDSRITKITLPDTITALG